MARRESSVMADSVSVAVGQSVAGSSTEGSGGLEACTSSVVAVARQETGGRHSDRAQSNNLQGGRIMVIGGTF